MRLPRRQHGDGGQHAGQHQEVAHLDRGRVGAGLAHRHHHHDRAEPGQREQAERIGAARAQLEHAEHQDQRQHREDGAAQRPRLRIAEGGGGDGEGDLKAGQRRVGEAPRPAAADGDEDGHHPAQRIGRPGPQRHALVATADMHGVVQHEDADDHQRHGQRGLAQAQPLGRLAAQPQIAKLSEVRHRHGR
jgi:hypothetical protein